MSKKNIIIKNGKKITLDDINDSLYGPGGFADRLADKIKEIGASEAGHICRMSTQTMHSLIKWRVAWKTRNGRPKLEIIKKYCDKLGVE